MNGQRIELKRMVWDWRMLCACWYIVGICVCLYNTHTYTYTYTYRVFYNILTWIMRVSCSWCSFFSSIFMHVRIWSPFKKEETLIHTQTVWFLRHLYIEECVYSLIYLVSKDISTYVVSEINLSLFWSSI